MKRIAILFFACLNFLSLQSQTGTYIPELAALDQSIQNFMANWSIPGGSVAISRHGKLIYARGFGFADTSSK